MNVLKGKITAIKTTDSISIVTIQVASVFFSTILIETPDTAPYLQKGNSIKIIFKETEVIIGKGTTHLTSIQNKIPGKIISIEKGVLLSKLIIDTAVGKITAIITSDATDQLQLKTGEKVTSMIKTTEIMLSQ
ncbi:molybdopterin-binding protein [Aquimarina sp. I32.4]|uniref:TOBE domain-containing protein n=1 Tax=Aquimarina sp. I32.4 TaxID=2053903 RepID=UPI000CDF235C|nr:TOBE domain-containing protein [Aquimarina sp. I32.4]